MYAFIIHINELCSTFKIGIMKYFTKMRILILLLAITFFAGCKTNPYKQAEEKVKKFFVEYETIDVSKAVDNLYSENKWSHTIDSAINNLKSQLNLIRGQVGEYNGYELITEKKVGDCFLQLSYIVKYDRMPIRFSFQFYKPKSDWIIYNFKFDTDVSEEMDKSSVLYFMDLDK